MTAILKNKEKEFRLFLKRVFQMDLGKMQVFEKMVYITFLTHLFQSLEDELVRSIVLDFVSVPLWANVSDGYFANLLNEYPEFSKLVSQRSSVDPRMNFLVPFVVYARFVRKPIFRYFTK